MIVQRGISGMAYIHLSDGKFRQQLPGNVMRRWRSQIESSSGEEEENTSQHEMSQLPFLSSNTPDDHIWSLEEERCDNERQSLSKEQRSTPLDNEDEERPSTPPSLEQKTKTVPFWAKKETSCDVEIDVHVTDILNVHSIMKTLPEDEVESQNIHWRAVPSLREIWQEERRRMAKLLEPKDDFLSRQSATNNGETGDKGKSPPPFTLSVKKEASTPGAMLAAKGMKRLLNITDGLENDFVSRDVKEIGAFQHVFGEWNNVGRILQHAA